MVYIASHIILPLNAISDDAWRQYPDGSKNRGLLSLSVDRYNQSTEVAFG